MSPFWKRTPEETPQEKYARLVKEEQEFKDYWKSIPREERIHPMIKRRQEYEEYHERERLERTGGAPPRYRPEAKPSAGLSPIGSTQYQAQASQGVLATPPRYQEDAQHSEPAEISTQNSRSQSASNRRDEPPRYVQNVSAA